MGFIDFENFMNGLDFNINDITLNYPKEELKEWYLNELISNEAYEVAEHLLRFVNSFSVDEKKAFDFIEHNKDKYSKLYNVIVYFVNNMVKNLKNHNYDDRNYRAQKMCENLINHCSLTLVDDANNKFYNYIAERLTNAHRTLQQSVAGLFFRILKNFENGIDLRMSQKVSPYWVSLPLI